MFDQVVQNLGKNREKMYGLQRQAASQKRINQISDDPLGASRSLGLKEEIKSSEQSMKNIQYSLSFLKATDDALQELNEILLSLKEIALSQSNDPTSSPETKRLMGAQVAQSIQHIAQVGNRKLGDRFIFSGFRTTTSPFDAQGVYHGDSGKIFVSVGSNLSIPINLTGDDVFGEKTEALNRKGRKKKASEHSGSSIASSKSVFQVVQTLEAALRENRVEGIRDSIESLDQLISQVILSRSQVGSRISRLEVFLEGVKKMQVNHRELISAIEDVDLFELVSDIQKTENTLKATLDISGRLVSKDLMDFLR